MELTWPLPSGNLDPIREGGLEARKEILSNEAVPTTARYDSCRFAEPAGHRKG